MGGTETSGCGEIKFILYLREVGSPNHFSRAESTFSNVALSQIAMRRINTGLIF